MDPTPPVKPAIPTPDAPSTLGGWFRQNAVQLVVVAAVAAVILRYLHPFDVLLAGFGLSLIIFIHELGHFLAAKWCDVHVKTFSIGFGPALPFCSFRYGETTYKLAMIPLGGYVAMVGEGDAQGDVVDADAEEDPAGDLATAAEQQVNYPRSFVNKPVGQRMLIISAGVIMNVILGGICFMATYLHGVDEVPAVVKAVEPGSAAWQAGLRPGSEVKRVNGREHPWFDDLRVSVSSTGHGETVDLTVAYGSEARDVTVEPQRQEGALLPQLGIAPPERLQLRYFRRDETPPYAPGSAAASATDPGFRPGDRIVAMTDPDRPDRVTPIDPSWSGLPGEYFDYHRRLRALAGKPVTFHVVRKDDPGGEAVPVTVPPAHRWDTGLRMRMGRVTGVRAGSDAAVKIEVRRTHGEEVVAPGDQIVAVELPEAGGPATKFSTDRAADPTAKPLDPLRLPFELNQWADRNPAGRAVKVTVLREADHTQKPVALDLAWDPAYRDDGAILANPGSPVSVGGLGIAYQVQTVVDAVTPGSPAAAAGLQPNDQVVQVRFKAADHAGKEATGSWEDVQPHQWAFVDHGLQRVAPHAVDLKVQRGSETVEASLAAVPDASWPVADRGLELMRETRTQKAEGVGEALLMGADRTARSIKMIYLGLYSMAFGRISVKMMSGPITLARASYLIAGEDIWHLLLWMGLISINLAVVNFLPIPVLDGGHMVFLIYEWVRGKPAPVAVQAILTYVGLAAILGLMLFVIGLDIWRLFVR